MSLLSCLDEYWSRVAKAFSRKCTAARTLESLLGLIAAFGTRTITAAITALGEENEDWSGRYRHFSRSPWSHEDIFKVAFEEAVSRIPQHWPFIPVALDDTSLPRISSLGGLAGYGRDPLSPPFHVNLRRGLRFIHAAVVVPHYEDGMRPLAVSSDFTLCPPVKKPGKKATDDEREAWKQEKKKRNLSTEACAIMKRKRKILDEAGYNDRTLLWVVDGSYTNKTTFLNKPERTHILGRTRKDIVLFKPGKSQHRYGERTLTPEQLRQEINISWTSTRCHYAGQMRAIDYKVSEQLRWRSSGTKLAVRVIVIRPIPYTGPGGHRYYRQPAYLLTTDLTTSVEILIQAYLDRWQIEVLHRDLKHELHLGDAQVRNKNSVIKLHASIVAMNALIQLAAQDYCGRLRPNELPPLPAWRRISSRRNASQQEIIAVLRNEINQRGIFKEKSLVYAQAS